MTKINKKSIEEGIELAILAMKDWGIIPKINLLKVPEDNEVKKGEFIKIAVFNGNIEFKKTNAEFEFYVPIPVNTHRDKYNWSWIIANGFLDKAFAKLLSSEGLSDKTKALHDIKMEVVDELIK